MKKAKADGKPFFVWLNTSRMHLYTRLDDNTGDEQMRNAL